MTITRLGRCSRCQPHFTQIIESFGYSEAVSQIAVHIKGMRQVFGSYPVVPSARLQESQVGKSGRLPEAIAKFAVQLDGPCEASSCRLVIPGIPLQGTQMVKVTCFPVPVTQSAMYFQRLAKGSRGCRIPGQVKGDTQIA